MKLHAYDVILRRVLEKDIECIRTWRNNPQIREFMFFQDDISAKMQTQWFHSISNASNYFFIIEYKSKDIGLIYAKNVNHENLEGEGGIFIAEPSYWNTIVPVQASFGLLEFCFNFLGVNRSVVQMRKDNLRAIQFNKLLGYKEIKNEENCIQMDLVAKDFNKKLLYWKPKLLKLCENGVSIHLEGEVSELNHPTINSFLQNSHR